VLAAAHSEGVLSLAGPTVQSQREALRVFQSAYPNIRLEYTGLGANDYEQRIGPEREVGRFLWDVYVSGMSSTVYTKQIPAGWYDPLKEALIRPEVLDDAKWLGGFSGGFLDTGQKFAYGFSQRVQDNARVNRDIISDAQLASPQDLLKPEFKGRIVVLDPYAPSAGSQQLVGLRKQFGDDFLRRLFVDQDPVVTYDRRQLAEFVVRGRYPIGIGLSSDMLLPFQAEGIGNNVKPLRSDGDPVGAGNGAVGLINRAPHPNAAKVFLNWLLSPDGQSVFAKATGYPSRRLDVNEGDLSVRPDPSKAATFFNPSNEENAAFYLETIHLIRSLAPR
jgi:ABC-type Fe3+ transport system substrate-binding protein